MKFIDLTGKRFEKLVVIKYVEKGKWLCKCDCGNEKIIRGDSLKQRLTLSCGCLHKRIVAKTCKNNFQKHGLSKTRLNNIYHNIKQRCLNVKDPKYYCYGGRGIKICDEWKNDFKAFYDWAISNGYDDNLTIDRIDNNGNYEPSNCRWATYKIQANNTRKNHYITYNNETHTLTEWASKNNIKISTLSMRLKSKNFTTEKALTKGKKCEKLKKSL